LELHAHEKDFQNHHAARCVCILVTLRCLDDVRNGRISFGGVKAMTDLHTAAKQALEALKQIDEAMPFPVAKLAQAALREALA
jgi:xanthine dehydrogenase iron-sulfur cluster and FAD-binding subunit A